LTLQSLSAPTLLSLSAPTLRSPTFFLPITHMLRTLRIASLLAGARGFATIPRINGKVPVLPESPEWAGDPDWGCDYEEHVSKSMWYNVDDCPPCSRPTCENPNPGECDEKCGAAGYVCPCKGYPLFDGSGDNEWGRCVSDLSECGSLCARLAASRDSGLVNFRTNGQWCSAAGSQEECEKGFVSGATSSGDFPTVAPCVYSAATSSCSADWDATEQCNYHPDVIDFCDDVQGMLNTQLDDEWCKSAVRDADPTQCENAFAGGVNAYKKCAVKTDGTCGGTGSWLTFPTLTGGVAATDFCKCGSGGCLGPWG